MIHETYLQIILKHIGEKLIIVYKSTLGGLTVEPILLLDANRNYLVADFLKSGFTNYKMNYYNDLYKNITCLYNLNGIDLLIAKKVETLALKIKDREAQKEIIKNLKGAMGQKVNFVTKIGSDYMSNNAIFLNMGIAGIEISVPPFYNKNEILKYHQILNIYNEKLVDLIYIN